MRPNKVETVDVRRLSICNFVCICNSRDMITVCIVTSYCQVWFDRLSLSSVLILSVFKFNKQKLFYVLNCNRYIIGEHAKIRKMSEQSFVKVKREGRIFEIPTKIGQKAVHVNQSHFYLVKITITAPNNLLMIKKIGDTTGNREGTQGLQVKRCLKIELSKKEAQTECLSILFTF